MADKKPHDEPQPGRRRDRVADDVAQAHQAQVNQVRHEPVRSSCDVHARRTTRRPGGLTGPA